MVCLAATAPAAKRAKKKPAIVSSKSVGAAALIATAQHELEAGNFAAAAQHASEGATQAPKLDDYAHYIRAQAEYGLRNYPEVTKSATHVFNATPISPFVGAAASVAVRADLDGDMPKQALELVRKYYEVIPEPGADLFLARSLAATGDLVQAVDYYQRVYYNYPTAKEATDAANALVDLKQRLGDAYKPPVADAMLGRAEKLLQAKNPGAARIELEAAIPQLTGVQRDFARVRLGEADYLNNNAQAAFDYLSALKVDESEADAERLSYLEIGRASGRERV